MNANLLSLAQDALGGDFSKLAGQFLGESQSSTQSALSCAAAGRARRHRAEGRDAQGASSLMSLINGANLDVELARQHRRAVRRRRLRA